MATKSKPITPGVCRVCGCTDDDCRACIARTGQPCHWVEASLCSACLTGPADARVRDSAALTLGDFWRQVGEEWRAQFRREG